MTTVEIVFGELERFQIHEEETYRDNLDLMATIRRLFRCKASWVKRPDGSGVGKVCLLEGRRTRFAEVRFWAI